jgi:Golgi nucleoside diphosphatase
MERPRTPSTKSLESGSDKTGLVARSSESASSRQVSQFLNSMSGRVTNKPKSGGVFSTISSFSFVRWIILFAVLLFLSYIAISFFELPPAMKLLDSDRSKNYRVKVLPASMTDAELHALPKDSFSYLAMIDAGSSGCRAHVYRYGKLGSIDGPLYVLPQHQSKKVKPGLSSFANNPDDAGPSLNGLVDFLREQVPEADWTVTPIWLKATAGLRMLPTSTSDAILESVRKHLLNPQNSPFYFRYSFARIIPGNEEGGFGWIAYNYLKKIIGPKKSSVEKLSPYTVIEMGGASAQVSQLAPSPDEAQKIPEEYRFSFTIEGEEYHLYTHSYLGFGAEQAKEQFSRVLKKDPVAAISDPCKHSGFTPPRRRLSKKHALAPLSSRRKLQAVLDEEERHRLLQSNASSVDSAVVSATAPVSGASCVRSVASLFSSVASDVLNAMTSGFSPVKSKGCTTNGPHSFGCVYQPHFVANSHNILAFENFYYMSSALGVKPAQVTSSNSKVENETIMNNMATTFPLETTPEQIKDASENFCSLNWQDVEANYPKDAQGKDVNTKSCFISAFSYSFLVDGLKIPAKKVITIQKEVGDSEIEWALGAAYKEAADFLKRTNLRPN